MAETILYRNFRKFVDQSKKNQSKTLNNIRDIEFTKLKLFCFKKQKRKYRKKQTGAIGPTGVRSVATKRSGETYKYVHVCLFNRRPGRRFDLNRGTDL